MYKKVRFSMGSSTCWTVLVLYFILSTVVLIRFVLLQRSRFFITSEVA